MATTAIPNKRGVRRHAGTNFIIHEVFSVGDLIDMNGVLVEWDSDGTWRWLVGREMHDMFTAFGVQNLTDVITAMDKMPGYRGSMEVYDSIGTSSVNYPMWLDPSIYIVNPPYPGNITRAARTGGRVYGIINNMHSGQGQSFLGALDGGSSGDYLGWGVASADSLRYTMNSPEGGTDGNFAARKTALLDAGGYAGTHAMNVSSDGALIGMSILRIPLGKTWEQFVIDLISTLPYGSKSEVHEKCHEKMDPMVAKIKAVHPIPVIYVPVEHYIDGWAIVLPQSFLRKSNALCGLSGTNSTQIKGVLYAPMRGGVYFGEKGVLHTLHRWWRDSLGSSAAKEAGLRGSLGEVASLATDITDTSAYRGSGTIDVGSIDGVRMERILGGLAGCNLSNTGEKDRKYTTNKTTTELVELWWNKLKFSGLDSKCVRSTTGSGAVETDAEYLARVQTFANMPETAVATRPTNWDLHGFSALHGMLALLAALDDSNIDSKWLQQIWPARTYLWLAPTYSSGYTATGALVAAPSPLL